MKTAVVAILLFLSVVSLGDGWDCLTEDPTFFYIEDELKFVLQNMGKAITTETEPYDFTDDGYLSSVDLLYWMIGGPPPIHVNWIYSHQCSPKVPWNELEPYLTESSEYFNYFNNGRILVAGLEVGNINHPLWGLCYHVALPKVYNFHSPLNIYNASYCWDTAFKKRPVSLIDYKISFLFTGGKPQSAFGYITDTYNYPGGSKFCGFKFVNGDVKGYVAQANYDRVYISYFRKQFVPVQLSDKYEFEQKNWCLGWNFIDYAVWASLYETEIPIPTIAEVLNDYIGTDGVYNLSDFARAANNWDGIWPPTEPN